jgi:drug/metabolite transporter (DMT)-like permease
MALSKPAAHLSLLAANLIYGINYSVAKDVMPFYIGPSGFVLMRVMGAVFLFWSASKIIKKEKIDRADNKRFILCALFGVGLNQLLFFEGLSLTTPINAGIIMVTTPILVLVISSLLIKERITFNKISGILLGVAGALFLVAFPALSGKSALAANPLGDFFIFLNAASYAIYLAMVKPLMKKYHTITVMKIVFMWGLLMVIPVGYFQFSQVNWGVIPVLVWWEIAFVIFCTTFLAYLFNTLALKAVTPTVAAIYIYLQPVLAALIAVLLGKDQIDLVKVISATLIFLGVYLVSKPAKKEMALN